jgi:hypothetical protein
MHLRIILAALVSAILPIVAQAQTNRITDTNLVAVTIYLTPANAALVADFQSNNVPMDTVVLLGAKAALNQARGRLYDEVKQLSFAELAAAYPQLVPIIDSNSPPTIQEQQLRTLVAMQLSKVRTSADATQVFELIQAARDTVRKKAQPGPSPAANPPSAP